MMEFPLWSKVAVIISVAVLIGLLGNGTTTTSSSKRFYRNSYLSLSSFQDGLVGIGCGHDVVGMVQQLRAPNNMDSKQKQQQQQQQKSQQTSFFPFFFGDQETVISTSDQAQTTESLMSNLSEQQEASVVVRRPEEGVQVSRTITQLMPDAAVIMHVTQDLDNVVADPCNSQDAYGDNDCHLHWSSAVTVNYTVQVNSTIVEGDTLEGHFTLDRILPWKFACPLCGQDCELQFPVLPLNYTIEMPPCPVPPHTVTHTLEHHLWEHSPTKGLVTTHLEGTVHLIRGSTQESIAEFSVSVTVR